MRTRVLAASAAAIVAALLAGCVETPYYAGGPYDSYGYSDYYGSGYAPGYYGPGYYDYGPGYYYGPSVGFSYSYRSGDGHHWDGDHHHWNGSHWSSRSFQQGSMQTHPRTSSRVASQPRMRSTSSVAHAGRHFDAHPRAAQQPSRMASQTRTGPDREHGGG